MHVLNADTIASELATRRIGRELIVLPEVDSTNTYALDRCAPQRGRAADGLAIFAEYQTMGRGRLGRTWASPRGAGLCLTVLLWEEREIGSTSRLVMAVACAVAEGIEEATGVDPVIRWPNDLYVADRKLAGILIESRPGAGGVFKAIGIGVNCLQQRAHFEAGLADRATSLELESRAAIDRAAVARAMLRRMDVWLDGESTSNDSMLAERWRQRSADIGVHVTLEQGQRAWRGTILDVHPQNGLILQLSEGGRMHFDPAMTRRAPP